MLSVDYSKFPNAKVRGLRFTILTSNEIRKSSACQVKHTTICDKTLPKMFGPNDHRMGTVDRRMLCGLPECEQNVDNCLGHDGHIELNWPMILPGFMLTVPKLLRLTCYWESHLMFDKKDEENVQLLRQNEEQDYGKNLFTHIATVVKPHKICPICQGPQPTYIKNGCLIERKWAPDTKFANDEEKAEAQRPFTTKTIQNIFSAISREDCEKLGWVVGEKNPLYQPAHMPIKIVDLEESKEDTKNPKKRLNSTGLEGPKGPEEVHVATALDWGTHPSSIIIDVLDVPPPVIRQTVLYSESGSARGQDDLTHRMQDITKANDKLAIQVEKETNAGTLETQGPSEELLDLALTVQSWIAIHMNNDSCAMKVASSQRVLQQKSVRQRIVGKTGRIRGNLMGKRCDFSARTVAAPDPYLNANQIGISKYFAKTLTYPERVTKNIKQQQYLLQCIRNGPTQVKGAKTIDYPDGRKILITESNKSHLNIYEGCIVERHLKNGDLIILNRNPSLHKKSIMAGFVLIFENEDKVVRVNPLLCKAYNLDFDGDEPNLHVPQSEEARAEMLVLMNIDQQVMNASNGKPILGPVQDPVLATYVMTRMDTFLDRETIMNMMMELQRPFRDAWILPRPAIIKPRPLWTGKQVLSILLPNNLFISKRTRDIDVDNVFDPKERMVNIIEGQLLTGALDGPMLQTIIHFIWRLHGGEWCTAFMSDHQRYMNRWFKARGFSVGIDDSKASAKTEARLDKLFDYTSQKIAQLHDETQRLGMTLQSAEPAISKALRNVINMAGQVAMAEMDDHNAYYCQAVSKSKGNAINISQIIGASGQQNVNNSRILPPRKNMRNFSHFHSGDQSPTVYGLVANSIFRGVTPIEYWAMLMAGREGLVDTAVKTAETGYIQRRLVKSAESNATHHDGTVRNNKGEIIQQSYGADGCDGIYMEPCTLEVATMTDLEIIKRYRLDVLILLGPDHPLTKSDEFAFFVSDELESLKKIRDVIRAAKYSLVAMEITTQIYLPVNIKKYLASWCFDIRNDLTRTIPELLDTKLILSDITLQMIRDVRLAIHECCIELQKLGRGQPCTYLIASIKSELSLYTILVTHHMTLNVLKGVLKRILHEYTRSRVDAGEMVGSIGAHSIGEPTMQMTLNTHSSSGTGCRTVTVGVPRVKELIEVVKKPRAPSTTVFLKEPFSQQETFVQKTKNIIPATFIGDVLVSTPLIITDAYNTLVCSPPEDQPFVDLANMCRSQESLKTASGMVLRFQFSQSMMVQRGLIPSDIVIAVRQLVGSLCDIIHSEVNHPVWFMRIRILDMEKMAIQLQQTLKPSLERTLNQELMSLLQSNVYLGGIINVRSCSCRKVITDTKNVLSVAEQKDRKEHIEPNVDSNSEWVIDTLGSNLQQIWTLPYVDWQRTISNDPREINELLGMEAAVAVLFTELISVMSFDGGFIQDRHILQQVDVITHRGWLMPISRYGINKVETSTLMKCSFEQTMEELNSAALFGGFDPIVGITESIMFGERPNMGSNFNLSVYNKHGSIVLPSPDVRYNPMRKLVMTTTGSELQTLLPGSRESHEVPYIDTLGRETKSQSKIVITTNSIALDEFGEDEPEGQPWTTKPDATIPVPDSPMYMPDSPVTHPPMSPLYQPTSPMYCPTSPMYCPTSPMHVVYRPSTPDIPPPAITNSTTWTGIDIATLPVFDASNREMMLPLSLPPPLVVLNGLPPQPLLNTSVQSMTEWGYQGNNNLWNMQSAYTTNTPNDSRAFGSTSRFNTSIVASGTTVLPPMTSIIKGIPINTGKRRFCPSSPTSMIVQPRSEDHAPQKRYRPSSPVLSGSQGALDIDSLVQNMTPELRNLLLQKLQK